MRPPRGEAAGALVLLHGRGTSELDLLPLLDELDPDRRLAGVTPRAPLELSPGGFHWYHVPRVGFPDPRTFFESWALLAEFLGALPDAIDVPWERTVLGGFSMGAVMSYALGLGEGREPPAAVMALSGFIPTVPGFDLDLNQRKGFPVAIGHGAQDPVISVEFARDARERLEQAGLAVLYRESRMLHSIDPNFLVALQNWVRDVVAAASTGGESPREHVEGHG